MTKEEREKLEYDSLFKDERYAKKAWRDFFGASLQGPGKPLPTTYDKDGQPTFQSQLDEMAYHNIKARLEEQGISREPMQAEIIVESQILRSRFSDTAFNTVLDRTAGKVKEELTVNGSPYEDLTDEELKLLMEFRNKKTTETENNSQEGK